LHSHHTSRPRPPPFLSARTPPPAPCFPPRRSSDPPLHLALQALHLGLAQRAEQLPQPQRGVAAQHRHHGRGLGPAAVVAVLRRRSEEHTSELQSLTNLACRPLL